MAIGQSIPRRTTDAVVGGLERYVADFDADGVLWARIVRSYEPHGWLRAIETEAASRQPGVVAVITAATLGAGTPTIPMRVYRSGRAERALQPVLATDRVRYVGEPYAVVLADSPFACEDAAETIAADVDPLPVVTDARAPAAEPLHQALPDDVADHVTAASGDVARAMAQAAVRVQRALHFGRQTACPMECRGLLALPGDDPRLTVVGPTKVKQFHRRTLAALLGLSVDDVQITEAAVGGSFGARGEFYPEDYLIPWLALRYARPVKWLEDRNEHFTAMNHAREAWADVEIGLASDGAPLALRARVTCDLGAYVRTNGLSAARAIAMHLSGPYPWRAWEVDVSARLTNKTPAATYRAPGAVEASYFREVVLDEAIREAGQSPLRWKRSWLPRASDMPYVVDGGDDPIVVESGDWRAMWDAAVPADAPTMTGVGSAPFFVEEGFGPADAARVKGDRDGGIVVEVGAGAAGQGTETALAQIAAAAIGVSPGAVRVAHRDVGDPPASAGTFASRVTVFTGNAVQAAALDFAARAKDEAAVAFACAATDVAVDDAGVTRLTTGQTIAFAQLASVGQGAFDRDHQTATSGVAFAAVEIDSALLQVRLMKLALAVDVGRAINPLLAEQQIIGGAMQGIGGALLEEIRYDEFGQPTQATFMDYHLPLACHLPELDIRKFEFRATSNPLGAKGAGEIGIVGVAAAVSNAIADAIGRPPLSVPCTPRVVAELLGVDERSDAPGWA